MKKLPSVKAILAIIAILLVNIMSVNKIDGNRTINNSNTIPMNSYMLVSSISSERLLKEMRVSNALLAINEEKETKNKKEAEPEIVYDGMTMDELAAKLDKNLKSTLKGYGRVFAEYSIKYEVDPYLSLAIVLHETGCASGKCSTLASKCNNIGGMRGNPGCGGGSYRKFDTLDQGIKAFYKNLSKNYYKKGLTTPEQIGKKYAESKTWSTRINYYINKIKKS